MAKVLDERGMTLLFSLFCLAVVGLLLAGAMTLATGQLKISKLDEDRVRAEYIAEAGARVGLNMIFHDNVHEGSWANQRVRDGSTDNYDLSLVPDNAATPPIVTITATGHTGSTSRTVKVIVGFKSGNPGLLDLFDPKTASLSHDGADTAHPSEAKKWNVSKVGGKDVGNPPDSGFNQILFNDTLDEVNGFTIDYYATLTQITNQSATGYGIYYFATGTADNMTAYVLQYDPGAETRNDGGAFFVKKVVQSEDIPSNPIDNETGNLIGRDFRLGFEDNNHANGTVKVSFDYIASKIRGFQILDAMHKITIDYHGGRHKIFIDGVLFLDFVDNDRAFPVPKHNAGTGLRVWNAKVSFYNAPSAHQRAPITVTWVRQ